jgi:hypothetical protein
VQITAKTANPNQSRSFFVTGTSVTDPTSIDTVRVKATSK